ncbi:fatty acid hydroxylase family protein [Pseudomonas sp. SJZ103]|nr:fatty acid hydroxylase family protein [Pseudomonas sp. SJZ103]TWC78654.1 fatty acid hydroxylase family protein [Pseudomonas sp. SJZ094]
MVDDCRPNALGRAHNTRAPFAVLRRCDTPLILLPVLLLLAWFTGLTSAFIGAVAGYFVYISLHYVMHRPQHWAYAFIPGLVANHDLHHRKGIEKNFGVSSPLWDHVFRTYIRTEHA